MAGRNRSQAYALAYASSLPLLQEVARKHGYALAVHGSMATDLDLIAAPWTEEAQPAEVLIEALRVAVQGWIRPEAPWAKPHGRLSWTIYVGDCSCYLDVSVMPLRTEADR